MQVLQIVDRQRKPLAQVTWEPPDRVNLAVLLNEVDVETKSRIEADLTAFLDKYKQNGVPLRTGRQQESPDGTTTYIEEVYLVKPDDERFLAALRDAINRLSSGEQNERFFALLQK